MTKTEQKILDLVRRSNELGYLAGAGAIVYLHWSPVLGAGWVLASYHETFKSRAT